MVCEFWWAFALLSFYLCAFTVHEVRYNNTSFLRACSRLSSLMAPLFFFFFKRCATNVVYFHFGRVMMTSFQNKCMLIFCFARRSRDDGLWVFALSRERRERFVSGQQNRSNRRSDTFMLVAIPLDYYYMRQHFYLRAQYVCVLNSQARDPTREWKII